MNRFREYQKAIEALVNSREDLRNANVPIENFRDQAERELIEIYRLFTNRGILPRDERSDSFAFPSHREGGRITYSFILIRDPDVGFNRHRKYSPGDDPVGEQLTREIAKVAQEKGIQVMQGNDHGHAIVIDTKKLREQEKGPETLFRALAAYAESINRKLEASRAHGAANRMQALREEIVGKPSTKGQGGSQANKGQVKNTPKAGYQP